MTFHLIIIMNVSTIQFTISTNEQQIHSISLVKDEVLPQSVTVTDKEDHST